ncbi:glutamate-gated chloride channel isoform X8 [Aphis craccivora]|uniref:Glutamate-gated chloride channel isoform X8 n=1 Tax=Aphis craccivora TaxID=307492 RepID=A0A6G0YY69_APHCR|nr:glutamate-gated chloride channel isoform X8 [Aphis craccivora]
MNYSTHNEIRVSIISVLLVLHQVWCDRYNIEDNHSRYRSYPRPSQPSPGGRRFGENYGWLYQREEGYWYHPESMWRWYPNNGWRQYSRRYNNNNYNDITITVEHVTRNRH